MTHDKKPLSKKEIRARNLAKLRNALDKGYYVDGECQKREIPLKNGGTVARDKIAAGLGFAKSAFQKVWRDGEKIDTEFAIAVNEYDLSKTGRSGADWGSNSSGAEPTSSDNCDTVKELRNQIDRLERRIGTLQGELDDANKNLASLDYVDGELDSGSVRLPW